MCCIEHTAMKSYGLPPWWCAVYLQLPQCIYCLTVNTVWLCSLGMMGDSCIWFPNLGIPSMSTVLWLPKIKERVQTYWPLKTRVPEDDAVWQKGGTWRNIALETGVFCKLLVGRVCLSNSVPHTRKASTPLYTPEIFANANMIIPQVCIHLQLCNCSWCTLVSQRSSSAGASRCVWWDSVKKFFSLANTLLSNTPLRQTHTFCLTVWLVNR